MCGVIGIVGSAAAAEEAYQALLLMQHRGQDSAGILTNDSYDNSIHMHRGSGLVDQVFDAQKLNQLRGQIAIGHTRYSTIGDIKEGDIQPSTINFPFGISLAHNGNVVNVDEIREYLKEKRKRFIFSNNDSEVMINLIADELVTQGFENFCFEHLKVAIKSLFTKSKGAYSVIGSLSGKGFFAFRDPRGIRPLVMGKRKYNTNQQAPERESFCFSSESNTINYLEYEFLRDLDPGELIYIDQDGNFFNAILETQEMKNCMFEWIYFANPESTLSGKNVYSARIGLGKLLAKNLKQAIDKKEVEVDVIVPIPESSRVSAIALSEESGIPYRELLIKNRYIQRSFILNSQKSREKAVRRKLSPVKEEIFGKHVLLVDDSIVRGTTSKHIIEMIRKCGAKSVSIASTCPPILHPCFYGIDFPYEKDLIAFGKSMKEIRLAIQADRIFYLQYEQLFEALESKNICTACLDGEYPVSIQGATKFLKNREKISLNSEANTNENA